MAKITEGNKQQQIKFRNQNNLGTLKLFIYKIHNTVNQILFATTLFRDLLDTNGFATTKFCD